MANPRKRKLRKLLRRKKTNETPAPAPAPKPEPTPVVEEAAPAPVVEEAVPVAKRAPKKTTRARKTTKTKAVKNDD